MHFVIALAGIFGAQAVISGAISAHGALSTEEFLLVEKAVLYQLLHALALIGTYLLHRHSPCRTLKASAIFFSTGILLFCQTLYLKAFVGTTLFPMSAPIGGTCLILGWVFIAFSTLKLTPQKKP